MVWMVLGLVALAVVLCVVVWSLLGTRADVSPVARARGRDEAKGYGPSLY